MFRMDNRINNGMNKKGLMLKFLVTIILAILVFLPACLFLSNFFRLSEQAEKSFVEFSEAIKEVPTLEDKKKTQILILDKDTFVAGYNANQNVQLCTENGMCGISSYPAECQGKSCLCLCQTFEETGFKSSGESIPCPKRTCQLMEGINFADGLSVANFHLDEKEMKKAPNLFNGYFRNGFMIVRGSLEFSGLPYHFKTFRRQLFYLTAVKEKNNNDNSDNDNNKINTIYLCKTEKDCKFRADLK